MNKKNKKTGATEIAIEFVCLDDGRMVLRECHNTDEICISIDFSQKIKDMLGDDTQYIGEHMLHAAMMALANRQANHYHAHVYDEEPTHYS